MVRSEDQFVGSFETLRWKRMENISWTDRVRNVQVLRRAKEERDVPHTVKGREVNWIGHILRRSCRLKYVNDGKMEGRIEVTGRWRRRR
jgi:hypothetical protein